MAPSYVTETPPTPTVIDDPLRSPLQVGGPRLRAFSGGVVTSAGITLFFDHGGRAVVLVVTAAICITIAVVPVTLTHLWYSPFLTGLGLGLLTTGTFLWFRPQETGAIDEWLIAVAVGSLLFWILPGRRGRPVFLWSMLVTTMIGVAVWGAGTPIDRSDHAVWRVVDSIEPSVVTLIIFAVAYTLYGMVLDQRNMRGVAGTFFLAAMIGAGWALILALPSSDRDVLRALLVTGLLLMTAGSIAGRRIVLHVGLLIVAVSAARLLDAPELTDNVQRPGLPNSVYIGVLLILFGLVLGRGVNGD